MTALARLLVRVFFRSIELEGGDCLPASGPVVLVANHTNGLVDGLLLMASLRRYPRFLGKATLFRIPPLWPFLKSAGVIPVYRTMDAVAGDHNVSAFATSHALLHQGGMVAVFPEGISHDEPALQPLRTGAARIALDAADVGGAEGLVTVAVGLVYDAKARFRSRALVRVAPPAGVQQWAEAYRRDERATVRAVTEDLAVQLAAVNPAYPSWAQAERLSRLAAVVVRTPGRPGSADVDLADQVEVAARLAARQTASPASLEELFVDFAAYERDLTLLGLRDAQLAAGARRRRLRLCVVWAALKVVLALPLAVVGVVVHVVPFQIMKHAARRPTNEGIKATVKLLGCFVLFTLTYVVVGVLIGRAFGAWAGAAAAVIAPLCGYVAVRLHERVQRIGGVAEGSRIMRSRRDVVGALLQRRTALVREARGVLVRS
ncbi:MAG TPA: lysophospholipid acyltransferase family protein [Acidimicrobiales bacterium]|jgi:1-acyl-sn-glycerol-3-phosphate acyltransferase|nr:lysophospholipid acyltransferase family protein [Acidimicrobiales bacterium]